MTPPLRKLEVVLSVDVVHAGKTFTAFAGGKKWIPMQATGTSAKAAVKNVLALVRRR